MMMMTIGEYVWFERVKAVRPTLIVSAQFASVEYPDAIKSMEMQSNASKIHSNVIITNRNVTMYFQSAFKCNDNQ